MPIIKRAKKKLIHDRKRTVARAVVKKSLKAQVKKTRKLPSKDGLKKTTSALDKAVKKHILHKNAASRLKSRLAKLVKKSK